jgi:hypothetical protein
LIAPSKTQGAVMPQQRRPAITVVTFQCPCGTGASNRSPRAARPCRRAMLVVAQVSSMNTRRPGSSAG